MTNSTPLPEQGGFNEKLDAIAKQFEIHDPRGQFEAAIRTLVLEEIIGEDETSEDEELNDLFYATRNGLRVLQRKKLGGTNGTK